MTIDLLAASRIFSSWFVNLSAGWMIAVVFALAGQNLGTLARKQKEIVIFNVLMALISLLAAYMLETELYDTTISKF